MSALTSTSDPGARTGGPLVARGLDDAARDRGEASYGEAPADMQLAICEAFAEGSLTGGVWERLSATQARAVGMRAVLDTARFHPSDIQMSSLDGARIMAAGAQDVLAIDGYAHLVGGCRMGTSPRTSVIDADHRVWDVPNLFVCDGSVMPTMGSANPALTIMARASRLGELLAAKRIDPAHERVAA